MNKVYYNQADSRWANHPYTCNYPGYTNTTIKSSGCGVTCGAMVISSCREIITPDKMGDLAMANGFRVPGGTADSFFYYICNFLLLSLCLEFTDTRQGFFFDFGCGFHNRIDLLF